MNIFIVTVLFILNGGLGVASRPLHSLDECDKVAASIIQESLKEHPEAVDFGWGCGGIALEGYPPAHFKTTVEKKDSI